MLCIKRRVYGNFAGEESIAITPATLMEIETILNDWYNDAPNITEDIVRAIVTGEEPGIWAIYKETGESAIIDDIISDIISDMLSENDIEILDMSVQDMEDMEVEE